MRPLIILIGLFLLTGHLSAQASATLATDPTAVKTSDGDVPNVIVEKFQARVPNMRPSWTDDGKLYMASYKDSLDLGHILTYDKNGNLLFVQDEQGRTSFPAPIERFHEEIYPGEPYTVWMNTDSEGNKRYYITRQKTTWWFDLEGNVIDASGNKKVKNP